MPIDFERATAMTNGDVRIGVDLGGTKIEALAIDTGGRELARLRIASPVGDYRATLEAVRRLVGDLEARIGRRGTVGVGMPGAVSPATGRIKNANSTQLNGMPFGQDLSLALGREVRLENDANCFALSEATDGAAAGAAVMFGVILGTGVGGGIVRDGRLWTGANAIAGEWGHNELPSRTEAGLPDLACYCGRRRCVETFVSGPGLAADHARHVSTGSPDLHSPALRSPEAHSPEALSPDAHAIASLARAGDVHAVATMDRYVDRLARALASVINVLDPDVVVLGGGLSNIDGLADRVASRLPAHVFSDLCTTPVRRNLHGDSSGVRGAAWLWPAAPLTPP